MTKTVIFLFLAFLITGGAVYYGATRISKKTEVELKRQNSVKPFETKIASPSATLLQTAQITSAIEKPTCTTQNTLMFVRNGNGEIGCDIIVQGEFHLGRSYCESQKTKQKRFLTKDYYGRTNRYYATLTNLDPLEEVRVYIYTLTGEQIECLPSLNKST